ncbi:Qin prophage protein [Escherichia coli]|uniref:Qin prophage protein n=1 Tax=Escherichia coli TaxID=562 RepID=A0A377DS57_ECOLX|nr:Qin prophage protein [Escherichia coli]
MTQDYELVVKGVRNFENKVTVTVALQDKENALTVKFLTWMSPWTVLKELRWSFMRQQPEGASGKSSWK